MRFLYAVIAVFLLIALLPNAMAETVTLKAGGSKLVFGKNISLISVYSDLLIVNVDGVQEEIDVFVVQNETAIRFSSRTVKVSGINITVNDVFEGQRTAELIVEANFVCGDKICSSAETSTICCKDCNCSSGYSCIDNQCIESRLNLCNATSDCNDSNQCTIDSCEGIPRNCSNIEIITCTDNDNCCPAKCYYENDSDCPRNKTKFECFSARDCIDADACTIDYCDSGKCMHEKKEGCSFNQTCFPFNFTETVDGTVSYCAVAGWQKQKKSNQECKENFECLSNLCEQGKCKGKGNVQGNEEGKNNIMIYLSVAAALLLAVIIYLFLKLRKK
jgi:hypothetical protein